MTSAKPARLALAASACFGLMAGAAFAAEPAATPAPARAVPAAEFLARNAKAKGVTVMPALQYQVVRSGPADGAHPKLSDDVTVHYEGKLTTGEVFDSSFKRGEPNTFPLRPLIPGWTIALQQMRPGDEWIVYVPPEMAYGAEDKGPIPANSVLIFRIQLISAQPHAKDAPAG